MALVLIQVKNPEWLSRMSVLSFVELEFYFLLAIFGLLFAKEKPVLQRNALRFN